MDSKKEEKLLALLFLNLNSRLKKTGKLLLNLSDACKELSECYGSLSSLAKKLGVSNEIIRAFVRISELPEEVKKLIEEEKINFDVAQRIHRLDKKIQIKIARMVAGMNANDARDLIQYAKRFPDESFEDFKDRLNAPRKQVEKYKLLIFPIENKFYDSLKLLANKNNLSIEKFIVKSLRDFLQKG